MALECRTRRIERMSVYRDDAGYWVATAYFKDDCGAVWDQEVATAVTQPGAFAAAEEYATLHPAGEPV